MIFFYIIIIITIFCIIIIIYQDRHVDFGKIAYVTTFTDIVLYAGISTKSKLYVRLTHQT